MILAVPCCQHELSQLDNATLAPLLRHGVLRERFAAEVTDAARAQLLGLAGYDVQLVEFVELEHTPKNVLIRARPAPRSATPRGSPRVRGAEARARLRPCARAAARRADRGPRG